MRKPKHTVAELELHLPRTRPSIRRNTLCYLTLFGLCMAGIINPCSANERAYHYELEISQDDKVCNHMLKVYNSNFTEPWNQQKFPITKLEDIFPRLPGVEFNEKFIRDMIYSKFPTSPEFEAIYWREGRLWIEGGKPEDISLEPMLVADFDIDNDGEVEVVFKVSFMSEFVTEGFSNPYSADYDQLELFPKGGIQLKGIQNRGEVVHGQINGPKPSLILGRQLRPFILDGVTYISIYEPVWPADKLERLPTGDALVPAQEYLNIKKYRGGGQFVNFGKYTELDLQPICRMSMIPKH